MNKLIISTFRRLQIKIIVTPIALGIVFIALLFISAMDAMGAQTTLIASIPVDIDIKPGSDPNSILCTNEKGVIATAILTTDDFDATTVDHTTVTFEGASETHVNKKNGEPRRHEEDVDKDGDIDLVFHFRFGDTDLTCGITEGTLKGETFDGQLIQGTDSVNQIPPYYYTALLQDPDASKVVASVGLLSFGLFIGLALVLGKPEQLKRRRDH